MIVIFLPGGLMEGIRRLGRIKLGGPGGGAAEAVPVQAAANTSL
jgi:hypothetical protein